MAGLSFFKRVRKVLGSLAIIVPVLVLSGCGEGDGPTSIPNSAVAPLNLPPGFCDPINFEIECELPTIIWFGGGQTIVVDNPDKTGINQSDKVARMQKFFDQVFGGTRLNPVDLPVDFSAGEAFKMKVWSEREVPVSFKLEESNDGSGGKTRIVTHGGGSVWEDLCFDFTNDVPANPTIGLTVIFEDGVQGGAIADVFEGDWTFYYDDITQVESCSDTPPTGIVPDVALYDSAAMPPIPADVEVTAFGSESVINDMYADDATYSPVLAVSSGVGYGANIAQIGFIGGDRGFLSEFESLDFKVKGMPNNVIFVKLFDSVDSLRINLTSSAFSGALTDGWYQVSIPISAFNGVSLATGIVFESDNTAPMQFTMLLTDIGFTESDDGGNGGNGSGGAITPDFVLFGTTVAADVPIPEDGPQNFGSGASFNFEFADTSFDPVIAVTAGNGYSPPPPEPQDVFVAFLAVIGYTAGFTDGFDTFNVKVKGSPDNRVEIKLIGAPGEGTDSVVEVNVTTYAGSTDLGDGWYQLSVPFSEFTNAGNIPLHNGWLVGPPGDQGDAAFVFLLTDVGFSDSAGGGNGGSGGGGDGGFVNGNFEVGLTGWSLFQFPEGVGSITADTSMLGGRAGTVGRLQVAGSAASANDAVISQEFLGAGTIMPGDSIDVSFDLYGSSLGAGGVVFVEVIFLNAAGEDVGGRNFVADVSLPTPDTPYTPTSTWTTYSGSVIAGTGFVGGPYDVSGGVVLSIKAACGAVDGCAVDASFDNVTFTIN